MVRIARCGCRGDALMRARIVVLAFLVFVTLVAAQALSDVILGPERMLDVATTGPFGNAERVLTGIASDGVDYFAIWTESMCEPRAALRGSRIHADGSIENPDGILIANDVQGPAAIQWNGSAWVIVWQGTSALYSSYVTRDGFISDPVIVAANGSYPTLMPLTGG